MARRFNKRMLDALRPPGEGRTEIGDVVVPGLVVRVTPRGVKSFSVGYKVVGEGGAGPAGRLRTGRQHRITLGQYPALDLSAARERARDILAVVSEGRDPRDELRERNLIRHVDTVEAVARRFIEQDARRTLVNWRRVERCLEIHVLPTLGQRPIRDVRRRDVHELMDGLVEADRAGTAREVRKHLHRLFEWAVDREIVADNPVHGMKRRDLIRRETGRALTDDELRAIWSGAGIMGYPYEPVYRLLVLTGQRRGDWARASRSEIDADRRQLEIPAARYKSRRDHVVPLAGPAWEIFEGLPAFAGNDYHLFSTDLGRRHIDGFSKAKLRLDRLAGGELAPWTTRDLRRTCMTRMADLGVRPEVRAAVLGHAKTGLQRTYNRHDYLAEKREALTAYAGHLMEIVG